MRYREIREHLRPYSVVAKRTTTINHAFAAVIAPSDAYDEGRINKVDKFIEFMKSGGGEIIIAGFRAQKNHVAA